MALIDLKIYSISWLSKHRHHYISVNTSAQAAKITFLEYMEAPSGEYETIAIVL